MNVSEQILEILSNTGVKQIWGVTGDALNTFTDAIRGSDKIRWNAVRQKRMEPLRHALRRK